MGWYRICRYRYDFDICDPQYIEINNNIKLHILGVRQNAHESQG